MKGETKGSVSSTGFWAWVVGSVGVSLVYSLQSFYTSFIGPITNLLPILCAGSAFFSALSCAKRYGFVPRTKFQGVWLSFTIGAGLWVAAEAIWAVYYFFFSISIPEFTVADIFYICGYLLFFAGIILYFEAFSTAIHRKRVAIVVIPVVLLAVLVLVRNVPAVASTNPSLPEALDDLSFIMLDLVLVFLAVLPIAIFSAGTINKWILALSGGSALFALADVRFLYLSAERGIHAGSFVNLIFLLAYLTFALAFYLHRREW